LARGRLDDGAYCPQIAKRVYDGNRQACRRNRKLAEGSEIYGFVHDHLVLRRWLPEQTAQRLRVMNPDDPSALVNHEIIYATI
jgi:IS30 family transposase